MMKKNLSAWLKQFIRKETVLCVSLVLALLSCLAVRPDAVYLTYPDYRTLALLFCLMLIVEGLRSLGVFERLGHFLLLRADSLRKLSLILVLLCFFCSMVITNDVTLITFVPFTLLIFRMIGREERAITLVVLETIAANLGSMATPIGNPQNLYLFSVSDLTAKQFALAVLPYAGLSLMLLLAVLLLQRNEPVREIGRAAETGQGAVALKRAERNKPERETEEQENAKQITEATAEKTKRKGPEKEKPELSLPALLPFLCLLILCLLVVFRVVPYFPVLLCVTAAVMAIDRRLFRSVDYGLLFTFLFFFIFIGNLKRIPALDTFLFSAIQGNELWGGILASQVISNVPAAILLSGFTENFSALITAVNLGGLGTLIASLASLISFKFCSAEYPGQRGSFLKVFTLWNGAFLLVLAGAAAVLE